jgi:hypothetical protein
MRSGRRMVNWINRLLRNINDKGEWRETTGQGCMSSHSSSWHGQLRIPSGVLRREKSTQKKGNWVPAEEAATSRPWKFSWEWKVSLTGKWMVLEQAATSRWRGQRTWGGDRTGRGVGPTTKSWQRSWPQGADEGRGGWTRRGVRPVIKSWRRRQHKALVWAEVDECVPRESRSDGDFVKSWCAQQFLRVVGNGPREKGGAQGNLLSDGVHVARQEPKKKWHDVRSLKNHFTWRIRENQELELC